MEADYGRIKISYKNINYINKRFLICQHCHYENETKGGIKTHLARKHNPLQHHYNLYCPYCPKTYRDLGSINRHIYKR